MNKPKSALRSDRNALLGLGHQGQRLSLANQRRRIDWGRLLRLQHPAHAQHQVMRLDLVEGDRIERELCADARGSKFCNRPDSPLPKFRYR